MDVQEGMELRRGRRFWAEHLAGWKQSGTSMKAYAAAHGLEVRDLYAWKRRLDKQPSLSVPAPEPPRFQPLIIEDAGLAEEPDETVLPHCRVELPNGVRIVLSEPLTERQLAMLLRSAGMQS